MSRRAVVSSGHYLATETGIDLLRRGGNAMDAAAATAFALMALQPHQNSMGGEAPILLYSAEENCVRSISGNGTAPRAATLDYFLELGIDIIPGDGFLPAITPPAVAGWILLLKEYGTMRFADIISPAIEIAREGFPAYVSLINSIAGCADRFKNEWPSSMTTFMPDGAPPAHGSIFKQKELAGVLQKLADADRRHNSRLSGLESAREEFYCGETARRIVDFAANTPVKDATGQTHSALLTLEDLANYEALIEDPVETNFSGVSVFKCGPWTQGPAMLQALNILSEFDLRSMGFNSADYIHTVIESIKLAWADREFYYGDPRFVDVPFDRLLSREYAVERAKLIDSERASFELRPGGYPSFRCQSIADVEYVYGESANHYIGDTTKLEVIDSDGNMVSSTPSGGWLMSSPVIPGLGFPLGTRGQTFSLVKGHPNAIEPGKRPRTSLTPSLAMRDGLPYMSFGSPGGDCQDQWGLLFLLNVLLFEMSFQEAVEAPTFWTEHFPSSFYPRRAESGSLFIEDRVDPNVVKELKDRGHSVKIENAWGGGNTLAAGIMPDTGTRRAAASPRYDPAYAAGLW